jgi:general secretion pathway protein D
MKTNEDRLVGRRSNLPPSPPPWRHSKRAGLGRGLVALLAAGFLGAGPGEAHAQVQTPQGRARTTAAGTTRQYPPSGTVGEAMISVDPETRRVIVITDEETSEHVGQVIRSLDQPKPQVLIKVVFLEVTYRNSSDIGIEGGISRRINDSTTGTAANAFGLSSLASSSTGQVANIFGQAVQNFAPVPPGAGLYQIFGQDFQATLRAIAEAGKLEVLSRPSILARNNQQATITVGQQVPLITNVRFDTFGNQLNAVTYQDVGIILTVTPFITSDGMVEMIVSPQISALSEQTVPLSTGVSAPVIDLRSADTVVVTPNGQTVIIGGLMQNRKTQTESKIPILGDIPLLGAAFKRKLKENVKTELIIFLTPYIVNEPSQLASLTATESGASEMAPKAFTEQELNQFLEGVPIKGRDTPKNKRK